jgi:O-methyltransferase
VTRGLNSGERRSLSVQYTLPDGSVGTLEIPFPLADGSTMVHGPLSYIADGMTSVHSVAWMDDPAFIEAYRRGMATGHRFSGELHVEWRVYTACWAAYLAKDLDGDFVELGVNTGIFSAAICSYIDFNRFSAKHFYLLDTFAGFPTDLLLPEELAAKVDENAEDYFDSYDLVRNTFAEYPNVVLVKGRIPETLPLVPSEKIAYLCIDLNATVPERAALEFFWDKVVPGGIILLDDYGYSGHDAQRRSFDAFALSRNVRIFSLPTGHGLLIKPYVAAPPAS